MSEYDSEWSAEYKLSLSRISAPAKISFTRTGIASFRAAWSTVQYADGYVSYDSSDTADTRTSSALFSDFAKKSSGTHTVSVKAIYSADRSYDSDITTGSYTLSALSAPTSLSASRERINGAELSWAASEYASQYDVYDGSSKIASDISATTFSVTGLSQGSHTFNVIAKYRTADNEAYEQTFDSSAASVALSLDKIASPSVWISYSQTVPGTATLSWKIGTDDSFYEAYISGYQIYLDGVAYAVSPSTDNSRVFTGLSEGTHTFGVKVLSTVSGYDSEIVSVSQEVVRLSAPSSLAISDIQDSDSRVTSVSLSWGAVTGADTYRIEDSYIDSNGTAGSQSWSVSASSGTSRKMSESEIGIGTHTFVVRAVLAANAAYDSDPSASVKAVISYIDNPLLTWASSGSSLLNISAVTNADWYDYELLSSSGASYYAKKITQTSGYNVYSIVSSYGLKTTSDEYTVRVWSRSNREFYYRTADSQLTPLTYSVRKISAPTNMAFDSANEIVTWDSVVGAAGYALYDRSSTGTTVRYPSSGYQSANSYDFASLSGLHYFYSQAISSGSDTENPKYLDSDYSATIVGGGLLTPAISRNNQYISWPTIENADSYEIYDSFYESAATPIASIVAASGDIQQYDLSSNAKSNAIGDHTIEIIAVAEYSEIVIKSSRSNQLSYTINRIDIPNFAFQNGTSVLSWDSLASEGASTYSIYRIDGTFISSTSDTSFTFRYSPTETGVGIINSFGDWYFYVTAASSDGFLHRSSSYSGSGALFRIKKLDTPVLAISATTSESTGAVSAAITWPASSGANAYRVWLNGTEQAQSADTSVSYSALAAGSYRSEISAIDTTQADLSNPKYIESDKGAVGFGVLAAPVISKSDNVISWSAVPQADYYVIYDGGSYFASTEATSYAISSYSSQSFSITVKAYSNTPDTMYPSASSNVVNVTITKLDPPVIRMGTDGIIKWEAVANASFYEVFMDNRSLGVTPTLKSLSDKDLDPTKPYLYGDITSYTSFDITGWCDEGTEHSFYVLSRNESALYITSDISNIVSEYFAADVYYKCVIDNKSYDISLPFTMTEVIDETLDSGAVTLIPMERKDPFEAYTHAKVNILSKDSTTTYRSYEMLIEGDDVEEVPIGTDALYKHHLTLVELTKELQTLIMPDLSLSADEASAVVGYGTDESQEPMAAPYCGINKVAWPNTGKIYGWADDNGAIFGLYYNAYKVNAKGVSIGIPKNILLQNEVYLPNDPCDRNFCEYYQVPLIGNAQYKGYSTPKRHWYVRKNDQADSETDEAYEARIYALDPSVSSNGWSEIKTAYDNAQSLTYKFPSEGKWDVMFAIDDIPQTLKVDYVEALRAAAMGGIPDGHFISAMTGAVMADRNVFAGPGTQWATAIGAAAAGTGVIPIVLSNVLKYAPGYSWYYNNAANMRHYRYVFAGINVQKKTYDLYKKMSVWSALQHVLACIQPNYTSGNNKPSFRYSIDPGLEGKLRQVTCPELTYEHGKTLFEIMLDIGRLFLGIPRLTDNNVITFDILSDMAKDAGELIEPAVSEPERSVSSMDNHATGFVSDLSNMVPAKSWDRYPSGGQWITARSGSDSDPYVNRGNISIVLPKKIFKILDVQVRNFADNAAPVSIKDHVFEKQIYDTLQYNTSTENGDNSLIGKENAIYWKKGDNKIMGLGSTPDADEARASIGWKVTDYAIMRILGTSKDDVSNALVECGKVMDYEYAIWYIPYSDVQTYTEQANLNGLSNQSYSNLNQENNTINDESFGQSAQTQVERLGNNSLEKTFRTRFITDLPNIASYKIYNSSKYYIDQLAITYGNSYYEVSESFSKNWNKINERVGINAEYRQYEISSSGYVWRDLVRNDYCYVSTDIYPDGNHGRFTNNRIISDISAAFNGDEQLKRDTFYLTCHGENGGNLSYYANVKKNGVWTEVSRRVLGLAVPATYYVYKNSIQYTGQMYDNYSAGIYAIRTVYPELLTGHVTNAVQQDARYVSSNGKCPFVDVTLCDLNADQLRMRDIDCSAMDWTGTDATRAKNLGNSLPMCHYLLNASSLSNAIASDRLYVDKDMREALRFSYQMHFITYDRDITIHSGITMNLYYNDYSYKGGSYAKPGKPIYVGYNGDIRGDEKLKYQSGDILGTPTVSVLSGSDSNKIKIAGFKVSKDTSYDGIALIWPNRAGDSETSSIFEDPYIIYEYKTPLKASDGSFTIPDIYLNFFNGKILNKTK